ncbi:17163_t:CDS:2 [Funneliformis caledonium]|uniref:17163_t:CDS:1 n=1 Tax=Funneliformis caledonium TaxID=1117310 RepID=A0A9N9G871_9GLOM|nr:17163_t:CDS:2 [Funneliformis caledonium]
MCHEKAVNALKKIVGEEKEKIILEKAKEWIKFRSNDSVGWARR